MTELEEDIRKSIGISVCVLAPEMPPVVGGAETFSEVLVLTLAKSFIKVYLITSKKPRECVTSAIEEAGGKVFALGDTFSAEDGYVAWEWAVFSRSQVLHNIITQYNIDIVHALSHDTIISSSIALCNLRKEKKIPFVITTSEMSTEDSEFGLARSKFVYNLPIDGLLQLSQYYVDVAVKHGCKPQIAKIAATVDVALFSSGNWINGRKKLSISEEKILITCPSRYSIRKGQIELIQAIEKLPLELQKKIVCLLAGSTNSASTEYFNTLEKKAKQVHFTCILRAVMREDMPDIFTATDLVVMPSYKEGLGFAAIESMVAGCPVLLYETSGFTEIPSQDGQVEFCEVGNVNMLSEKIEELITNKSKRELLAKEGQKLAKSKFSTDEFANQVISLYNELLNRK